MQILEHISLKPYHTFGIEVSARYFVEITSLHQLQQLLVHPLWKKTPKLIIGQGSNLLFSQDYPGLVIKMALTGINKVTENADHVWIDVAAGENWHQLVLYCIEQQWAGIENLSLIPGTVGAAPIQNIGAYGVELREVLQQVTAIRLQDGAVCTFDNAACCFAYRDSIFKQDYKNQYMITSVQLRLNKTPCFHLDYGAIKDTLADMQVNTPTIKAISDAVIRIRQQKLPDPKKIGNAGSFFKSPILSLAEFKKLQHDYPEMPYFIDEQEHYKIPAGWLIERCGWKGKRLGDAGVHEQHALVLVNYGYSSGQDIKHLAEKIQHSVKTQFSIDLLPEVNII